MLNLFGNRMAGQCDGSTRRDFLKAGVLGMGGLGEAFKAALDNIGKLIPDTDLRTKVQAAAQEGQQRLAEKVYDYAQQLTFPPAAIADGTLQLMNNFMDGPSATAWSAFGVDLYIQSERTSSSVPAPTSLALLAIAFAGLGWSRRKK